MVLYFQLFAHLVFHFNFYEYCQTSMSFYFLAIVVFHFSPFCSSYRPWLTSLPLNLTNIHNVGQLKESLCGLWPTILWRRLVAVGQSQAFSFDRPITWWQGWLLTPRTAASLLSSRVSLRGIAPAVLLSEYQQPFSLSSSLAWLVYFAEDVFHWSVPICPITVRHFWY